ELLCHGDLRRQQTGSFHLTIEKSFEPCAEATHIVGLDVFERQIFLQRIGHVEVAAGAHSYGDGHVLEVLRTLDSGIGPHENRPGRYAVGFRHEPTHAGAGITYTAPYTRALDHILALGIDLVLWALEIGQIFP